MAFNPTITEAGLGAYFNAESTGVSLALTHIAFGSGAYDPTGVETALVNEVKRVAIGGGTRITNNQIRVAAIWVSATEVAEIREIGFYAGDVLFAVLSRASGVPYVYKTAGSNLIFSYDWTITAVAASNITVTVDPDSMALLVHLADADAHPQYLTIAEYDKRDPKNSVRVATTANITLSGTQTIDGVAVVAGDRVLVKNQTSTTTNGIYIVSANAWTRATDADESLEVTPGMLVPVEQGTVNGDSIWQMVTDGPVTLGTSAIVFEIAAGPSGITAGTYKSLTVDKRGRVTGGTNPTTIAGYGITDGPQAFGVGAQAPSAADLNALTVNGIFAIGSTTANSPVANSFGTVIMSGRASSEQTQIALINTSATAPRMFVRNRYTTTAGIWGPWQEVWHTGNLVKQSSLTDTTTGALLINGAHGLGSSSPTYQTDPNLERVTGVKGGGGSTSVNYPAGASVQYGPLLTLARGNTGLFQLAMLGTSGIEPELYMRGSGDTGATWSSWRKVWSDGNTARLGGLDLPGTAFHERELVITAQAASSVAIPNLPTDACDILLFGLTHSTGTSTNFVGRFSKVGGSWVATNIYGATGSSNYPSIEVVGGVPHIKNNHSSAAYTFSFRMSIATQSSGQARPFEFFANLWHTSNLVKQANATDTTAGAMLVNGAFGLGHAITLAAGVDINSMVQPGTYVYSSGTAPINIPTVGAGFLEVIGVAVYPRQRWTRIYQNRTFERAAAVPYPTTAAADWTPWVEVFHSGNFDPASKFSVISSGIGTKSAACPPTTSEPSASVLPYTAGLELRESGQLLKTQGFAEWIRPALSFHWGGQYVRRLSMDESGRLWWGASRVINTSDVSAFIQTLFDDPDGASARATLGANNASNLNAGAVPVAQLPGAVRNQAQGSSSQDPNSVVDPVILTNHANSPGQGFYWHITTTYFATISATGNRGQVAVSYNSQAPQMWARSCYQGVWYPWVRCDGTEVAPPGKTAHFAMSVAPTGWLKANGAAVSRTSYAALFAAIGTTFGAGDGSTTFNLPDMRGEFVRGWDDGRGVDSGRAFGSAQADELASHTHTVKEGNAGPGGSGENLASGDDYTRYIAYYSTSGATGGTETRPRNIALLACIKY